jgi:heme A synthase
VFIAALLVWTWRSYPRGSALRWASGAMGLFIVTESLLGAALVLFSLVDQNASVLRAVSMMAHLINTFLLLAGISLTAWWSSVGEPQGLKPDRGMRWMFGIGVAAMMLLGASGAIAALGDTLFPSRSLLEGLQADIAAASNYLVRLRIFHPGIAILTGAFAALFAYRLMQKYPEDGMLKRTSILLMVLIATQLGLGLINVLLLAPVWLQLVHLLMTSLVWILYVLTGVLGLVSSHLAFGIVKK